MDDRIWSEKIASGSDDDIETFANYCLYVLPRAVRLSWATLVQLSRVIAACVLVLGVGLRPII